MHFDTDGVYTLQYTAEDSCGNETIEEREVLVGSPRTAVYSDKVMIINEQPKDFANNATTHGQVLYEFDPMFEDGSNYVFSSRNDQPWKSGRSYIQSVEFGEPIKPVSMAYWFASCTYLTSIDSTNLDTSRVTDMQGMFAHISAEEMRIQTLDLSTWDTSKVTNMSSMFARCYLLDYLDASTWDTSSVTDMSLMFYGCYSLNHAQISQWDVSNVTTMEGMFSSVYNGQDVRTEIDLSGWNTSSVTNMSTMFANIRSLQTIYASSSFVTSQVASSDNMFINNIALVGGSGTAYSSSYKDKTYARVDNPPTAPGYFTAKA